KSGELDRLKYKATHHGQEPQESLQHIQPPPDSKEQAASTQHREPLPQDDHPRLQRATMHVDTMPDLSAIQEQVRGHHGLVSSHHQTSSQTHALEEFAKVMHIQGVRTDAAELSDAEIKKIQRALDVKDDGLVGNKTLAAMEH